MKVVLGTFKDKGDELAAFLEPRVGSKPTVSGGSVEFGDEGLREGVKPRHVKTYIKRFLYMNGARKKYRVFVSGKELTIQEVVTGEEAEEEEEKKKAPEKKPEEAKGEEAPEEPEAPEEEAAATQPKGASVPEEKKPKKAAAKKPRAGKKKKSEED